MKALSTSQFLAIALGFFTLLLVACQPSRANHSPEIPEPKLPEAEVRLDEGLEPANSETSECDISALPIKLLSKKLTQDYVFPDSVPVHCLPDANSPIINTLKISSSRAYITGQLQYKDQIWHEVPAAQQGEPKGYIQDGVFSEFEGHAKDMVLLGKLIDNDGWTGDLHLKCLDRRTKEVSDTKRIEGVFSFAKLTHQHESILDQVDALYYLESSAESCPGGDNQAVIALSAGKIIPILSYSETGDDGEEYAEFTSRKIYLPINSGGKHILAPNGSFEQILQKDLSLDTLGYPADLLIPRSQQLVVEKTISNNQNNKVSVSYTYYKWDGASLSTVLER